MRVALPDETHVCSLMYITSVKSCTQYARMYTIQLRVSLGCNINLQYNNFTWLELAIHKNDIPTVKLLLYYNANMYIDHGYPLRRASCGDRDEILTLLIQAGIDVNIYGKGSSAINVAILSATVNTCKILVEAGAVYPGDVLDLARCSGVQRESKLAYFKNINFIGSGYALHLTQQQRYRLLTTIK